MSSMSASNDLLSFRLATPADAATLAALINRAFRSEKTGQTWLFDSQDKRIDIVTTDLIQSFITAPNMVMLVGVVPKDPTPITTCYLREPSEPTQGHMSPGAAWLGFLATLPDFHKRGYGLVTLREAERFVKQEWGAGRLEIDFVSSRLQLRAWYERCGYLPTGKKREFPYGERGRDILADGLEMVVLGKNLV